MKFLLKKKRDEFLGIEDGIRFPDLEEIFNREETEFLKKLNI